MINKYKSLSIQAKASIWYTICNIIQNGISFFVVPVYIRFISTAEYGAWSVFLSWKDILFIFASLNLYCGVFTKKLVDIKDDRDRFTASMQGLGTVVSLIMFAIYLVFHEWCNSILGLDTPIMILLFLFFILFPAFSFWGTRQRVEYKYKPVVVVTAITAILTPSLSLFFVISMDLGSKGLILGFLISQSLIGLVFYIYHFIKGKCFIDIKYWKYALHFNIPLIPHYLSLFILGQSDRIMIKWFCGEGDVGIYSFAYQIGIAIIVFISAIDGSRVPWTYEQLRDRIYDRLKEISNALCLGFGVVVLGATLLAPDVIYILGTEDYSLAVYVIPVIALSMYYAFIYDMFSCVEFYYGATKYVMTASVIGAASNIILNAWLIPVFGFIVAAYTTLFSYFLFILMHYYFMHVVMRQQNIKEEVYDIKFTVVFSGILSVLVLLLMLTYKANIVRYLLISGLCIIVFINKDMIIRTISTLKNKSTDI